MRRRQTAPSQWLMITDEADLSAVCRLPRGSGIVLLTPLGAKEMRWLRLVARRRGLFVLQERRGVTARVHTTAELRSALLARTPLVMLSPIHPTRSHPGWTALPPMRAAALARLGGRKLIALGGMDARKFQRIERLGFQGWAGISAFRT
jgi:thiamine-phosphate pyrophosphorylase